MMASLMFWLGREGEQITEDFRDMIHAALESSLPCGGVKNDNRPHGSPESKRMDTEADGFVTLYHYPKL